MFNIKKKIYVAHADELVDLMYERSILLHPSYTEFGVPTFEGIEDDINAKGVVFTAPNLDSMIETKFDGDILNFHDFLAREGDLLIVVGEHDYARLLMQSQLELQKMFGITDEKLKHMRDMQRLKDFFDGPDALRTFCSTDAFEDMCQAEASYVATGKVYGNILELPVEIAYAMYKWGNISAAQVNVKFAALAEGLLLGQIHNLIESAKVGIGQSPALLQEFLGDDTIVTVDDMITAVSGDPLLKELFCHKCEGGHHGDIPFDLTDEAFMAELKRFCHVAIDNELDFDAQPDVDKAELDFFFDLYEQKDISVIENAKYNFISTGMISSKAGKFNSTLIMSV